jgi:hypothetical protein
MLKQRADEIPVDDSSARAVFKYHATLFTRRFCRESLGCAIRPIRPLTPKIIG